MHRDLSHPGSPYEIGGAYRAIVCFPIRSASDATLQGVEIRSRALDIDLGSAPSIHTSRVDWPVLDVDQLEWVLGKPLAEPVSLLHRTRIWIPLSIHLLAGPWARSLLLGWLGERHWDPGLVTFAFSQREATLEPQAFAACLRSFAACGARVALTEVGTFLALERAASGKSIKVDEVRLSGPCTASSRGTTLCELVERLHREQVAVTALDVSSVQQCEAAIAAGVDLVQGDSIGRPFNLKRLAAALQERDPEAPGTGYGETVPGRMLR